MSIAITLKIPQIFNAIAIENAKISTERAIYHRAIQKEKKKENKPIVQIELIKRNSYQKAI